MSRYKVVMASSFNGNPMYSSVPHSVEVEAQSYDFNGGVLNLYDDEYKDVLTVAAGRWDYVVKL